MNKLQFVINGLIVALLLSTEAGADTASRVVTGDVIANRSVTLATRVMGRVTAVHAEEGDSLEAGTIILELDDAELQARLRVAQAAEERALAEQAQRKRVMDRLKRLASKNATSAESVDEAEYAFQVAAANLKAARAEIDSIKATLAETLIRVPFNAVVTLKHAEIGMVTQPGEPLFQVQDQERLKFRARIKERDLAHIKLHDVAHISITAMGEEPVKAEVIRIIPFGDQRHTFAIELALPNQPGLYPGMFGKAVFAR